MLNSRNIPESLLKIILKTKNISLKKLLITLVTQPLAITIIIFIAREALLHASTSPWVETLSGILFLLMAKCRGDGREPSQRV